MKNHSHPYDVAIIGAGASGSALVYTLAKYSTINRIALIEKHATAGQVNSKSSNNSQTLHVGDIETNYSLDKVRQVYPAAMMIARYGQSLQPETRNTFLFPMPKMVLAVEAHEVALMEQRYADLKSIFPRLQKLSREDLATIEPATVIGRDPAVPILALYTTEGYAVNFETLAQQWITHAHTLRPDIDLLFSHHVDHLEKQGPHYVIHMKNGTTITTKVLVVNADSYSLLLAQQLGYGKEFSLIPIAGSFYFSKKILTAKVYTVQEPKLPFAAVHGDPDIMSPDQETRWGPTARFYPVLEARNLKTFFSFLKSSGLERPKTWLSFAKILLDPIRLKYLLENMLYEIPGLGKHMFIKNVQKIVPSLTAADVRMAQGYGGMRLQRVDTNTKQLLLGEGKIVGDHALFNMTPSPGASVALYNAMRDTETIAKFLGDPSLFNEDQMLHDLYIETKDPHPKLVDVSQKYTYTA